MVQGPFLSPHAQERDSAGRRHKRGVNSMPQKRAREDAEDVDVTELKDYLKGEEAKLRDGSKEVAAHLPRARSA